MESVDYEKAVLCAVLESKDMFLELVPRLAPSDFTDKRHRSLWRGLQSLHKETMRADAVRVKELVDSGKVECDLEYIRALRRYVPDELGWYSVSDAPRWADKVAERSRLRHMREGLSRVLRESEEDGSTPENTASGAMSVVLSLDQGKDMGGFVSLAEEFDQFEEMLGDLLEGRSGNIREPTGFRDLDDVLGGGLPKGNLTVIGARPGMFKCLRYDQTVLDGRTGERVAIEEFVGERRDTVLSLDESDMRLKPRQVADWVDTRVQPCVEVRFASGRSIVCTPSHPFLTIDGWKPVSMLGVGSFVATPRRLPVYSAYDVGPRARLLGYLLGDGTMTRSVGFTNGDPELRIDFERCVRSVFPDCTVTWSHDVARVPTGRVASKRRFAVRPLNQAQIWLGRLRLLGCAAGEKFVPDEVFLWSKDSMREFLRALFTCDGTFEKGLQMIGYTSKSKRLVSDVQHLLLRFGVVGRIYPIKSVAWRVNISGQGQVETFLRDIGFVGAKQPEYTRRKANTNVDFVPPEVWSAIDEVRRRRGMSLSELERARLGCAAGYNSHRYVRAVGRDRLLRYAEILGDERLRALAQGDVFWDRIVAVTDVGEARTYDLSVPEGQNFVAGDVLVHNTAIGWKLAQNVAERLQQEGKGCVAVASLEMSREELLARAVSADARVVYSDMVQGKLSARQKKRVFNALEYHRALADYVQVYDGLATSDFLRYQTLLMMARNDVRLLVIDFAEMVADEGPSELERVSGIFLAARKLAKERNIPVVLLSQLNRQVEYEPSRMPESHHLKMGGEAVAAVVLLLYYPYKYEKNGERVAVPESLVYQRVEEYDSTSAREAKNWANKGRLYVKVGKSRFGGNSIVTLNVVPEWLLLADYDPESERSGVVKLLTRQGEHDEDF